MKPKIDGAITIGTVLKPQGIRGEIKIMPMTDDPKRFLSLEEVFVKDASFPVLEARLRDGFAYLRLGGIADRNAAETLVGCDVRVDRAHAVPLAEGRYFVEDLLHAEVFVGDDPIGIVTEIDNYGSADVYTVRSDRTVRFPLLKRLIVSIDPQQKRIVLDPTVFGQVAVYED